MSSAEGFRFAEDPLSAPVFATAADPAPAAVCRGAVGARLLTRMLFFAPSMLSVCVRPTSALLAAP